MGMVRKLAWLLWFAACGSPASDPVAPDGPQSHPTPDAAIVSSTDATDVDAPVPQHDAAIDAAPILDAPPGGVDWTAIAAACGTLRSVARVSETELVLACGAHGAIHVTPAGVTTWTPTSAVLQVAVADGELRALACNDVYRYNAGAWALEGHVGTLSSCGMGFAGGGGGWFVGTRSFGGDGGFWMRPPATGAWVVGSDTVRGFEDFVVFSPTEYLANTIGVSTGLQHMKKTSSFWSSASDFPFGVRAMWRVPGTSTVYFANTPGNGPGNGTGGIYHWSTGASDTYTFEWDTPDFARINAIWGTSATDIWAAGDAGTLVHSTGNGTWTAVPSGTTADIAFLWHWDGHLVAASTTAIHLVD